MRLFLFLAAGVLSATAAAQTTSTSTSQLDALADRLATAITATAGPSAPPPNVLVTDFLNQRGAENALGLFLADNLSEALQVHLSAGRVLNRKQFLAGLRASHLSQNQIADRATLQKAASQFGADILIGGRIVALKKGATLQIDFASLPDAKSLGTASADLPLPAADRSLLETPIDWPTLPDSLAHCDIRGKQLKAALEDSGIKEPTCSKCPAPAYPPAALHQQWDGAVVLNVVVDSQGHAGAITVDTPAPYEADKVAIATVKKWQFHPATQNGKPITLCVQVEVRFHSRW